MMLYVKAMVIAVPLALIAFELVGSPASSEQSPSSGETERFAVAVYDLLSQGYSSQEVMAALNHLCKPDLKTLLLIRDIESLLKKQITKSEILHVIVANAESEKFFAQARADLVREKYERLLVTIFMAALIAAGVYYLFNFLQGLVKGILPGVGQANNVNVQMPHNNQPAQDNIDLPQVQQVYPDQRNQIPPIGNNDEQEVPQQHGQEHVVPVPQQVVQHNGNEAGARNALYGFVIGNYEDLDLLNTTQRDDEHRQQLGIVLQPVPFNDDNAQDIIRQRFNMNFSELIDQQLEHARGSGLLNE